MKLYYQSAYCREFEATVLSCRQQEQRFAVVLDRTAFYPEGGGQPADHGSLWEIDSCDDTDVRKCAGADRDFRGCRDERVCEDDRACGDTDTFGDLGVNGSLRASGIVNVTDVQEADGEIVHFCDRALTVGSRVAGRIDWTRRFDHMQQHSGEHIVSGMICRRFDCDNVGFHLGHDVVTIDYNARIGMDALKDIEDAANAYLWENHPVQVLMPDAEALQRLEYRSKKELTGAVRIVSFPGADTCACCGTHVRYSAEAGPVKIISCQSFTKGTRIGLLCGKRALDFLSMNFEQNATIGRAMASSLDRTSVVYLKQKQELAEAKIRLSELEKRYIAQSAEQYRGVGNVLLIETNLSPDGIRRLALSIGAVCGGMSAVFCGEGSRYQYALSSPETDIRALLAEMNRALAGRGGGKQGFAQGSVHASEKKIRDFFGARFEMLRTNGIQYH